MTYTVPVSSIPLLLDPPFVIGLVWLAVALGYRSLLTLRAPLGEATPLERGVLAASLGSGLLAFGPFLLGMSGMLGGPRLLTPVAIWVMLAALALLFARDMGRVARGAWRAARQARHSRPPDWVLLGILILCVSIGIAFLQSLAPAIDYDGTNYHLAAPKRWLQAGRMEYLPTIVNSHWPMGVEMLFTLALAVWSDTAAKLIHFALGILALLAIFALGNRVRGPAVGFTAAFLLALGVPRAFALHNFTYPGVEMGITLQVTSAMLAWMLWARSQATGWLWSAALCAGFAASFKLTGAFVGLTLAVLTFWEARKTENSTEYPLPRSLGFTALALAPMLLWLCRTWLVTGNPVWPWLTSIFPTRDWTPQAGQAFNLYFKYENWGGRWLGGTSIAQRQAVRLGVLGVGALMTVLALWRWRDRDRRVLLALAATQILLAIWSTGIYIRFFMPVLALLYIALLWPLAPIMARARLVQVVVLLLLAANTFLNFPGGRFSQREAVVSATGHDIGLAEVFDVATGRTSRARYLANNLPITGLWEYANHHLPPDAGVMTCGFSAVFYSDQRAFWPDLWGNARFCTDTPEAFARSLERDYIRYFVLKEEDRSEQTYRIIPTSLRNTPLTEMRARCLIRQRGRVLYTYGGYALYGLEPTTQPVRPKPSD